MRSAPAFLVLLAGCNNEFDYAMGWGATYTTRCAARMAVEGDAYRALCDPPSCAEGFTSVAVSQAVAALDPGLKVLGNAERTCVQDASQMPGNAALVVNGEQVAPPSAPRQETPPPAAVPPAPAAAPGTPVAP